MNFQEIYINFTAIGLNFHIVGEIFFPFSQIHGVEFFLGLICSTTLYLLCWFNDNDSFSTINKTER